MLSLAAISRLFTSGPVNPSTFSLYEEAAPPINFTEEIFSFWLFSLMILNAWVMEPVVVKTVSYFNVSAVILTCASGDVIKESFLQANKKRETDKMSKQIAVFIEVKNN